MNPMLSNLVDPAANCRVLIHFNNGVPKVWIAVGSTVSKTRAWRIWGSLKRGGLQMRESLLMDTVCIAKPKKLANGYREIPVQPRWFEVQQLVAAYLHGKPFLSFEGYQLGRVVDNVVHNVCRDINLQAALFKTSPGVLGSDGGLSKAAPSVPPARVMGKDDILKGVTASTGRPYAW